MAERYFGAGLAAGLLIGVGMFTPGWVGLLATAYGALIALTESPNPPIGRHTKTETGKT